MKGIIRIDRVAAQFEIWLGEQFPFAKMKVKILERTAGDYLAVPNVAVRNITSHEAEFTSGMGGSIEEALNDLLTRFVDESYQNAPPSGLSEQDFVWSQCEEF